MKNIVNHILLAVILACIAVQALVITILFVGMVVAILAAGDSSLMDICEYILLGIS